jgi:hypothetical protein
MHRVVVTANRDDYIALSKDWNTAGKFHAGIVVRFPQGAPPFRSAAAVKRVLGDHPGPLDGLVLWANAR